MFGSEWRDERLLVFVSSPSSQHSMYAFAILIFLIELLSHSVQIMVFEEFV